jgi:outer membrane biosynthesis protein TonB
VSGFEVVVTDDGNVESVRASNAPQSIGETLQMTGILSAAKSWRFRPAEKDGQSVRYRLQIWLRLR